MAKSHRQGAMFGRTVTRDRAIKMRPGLRNVARTYQGNTHDAVRNEERRRRSILLCQRQELRGKLAHRAAVEPMYFPTQ